MSTEPSATSRIAILCVIPFVVLNLAFFVLSRSYFAGHLVIVPGKPSVPMYSPEQIAHVRMAFGVFSAVIAAAAAAASLRPRVVGHGIPFVVGAINLIAGVFAFAHGATAVLGMTLVIAGILMPVLAVLSLRGSRGSWAFLLAICGVFAIAEVFGSPKIRGALDISLWTTMILPGLNLVAALALWQLRDGYVEQLPSTTVTV
jgi:hypothetical protein